MSDNTDFLKQLETEKAKMLEEQIKIRTVLSSIGEVEKTQGKQTAADVHFVCTISFCWIDSKMLALTQLIEIEKRLKEICGI